MAEIIQFKREQEPEEGSPVGVKVGDPVFRCGTCHSWQLYAVLIDGRSHLRCGDCAEDHTITVWG